MRTDELRLLDTATELARAHPAKHAVILDLSGVLHIDEPVFRRTLIRWLRGEGKAAAVPEGVQAFELSRGRMALVIDDPALAGQRAHIANVAEVLAEHRRGAIQTRWFALSRAGEAERFAGMVRDLAMEAGSGDRPGSLPVDGDLDRFLTIERSLHAIDLSALVRQGAVHRLQPGGVPQIVMLELTVALSELDRMFDIRLADDPWLYDRVTELLDRRMVYHLARDRDDHPLPLAVKMHAGTVAGEEFAGRMGQLPAKRHGRLVVELPWLEWARDRDLVVRAITVARRLEMGVALDHVPVSAVVIGDLPEVDLYRIQWVDDAGHRSDLTQAGPLVEKLGASRCLLARCIDAQAVTDGLAAGIRLFQGRAVDRMAADQIRAAAEKRAEELVQEEKRSDAAASAMEAKVPAPAAGGLMGWVRQLLRRPAG